MGCVVRTGQIHLASGDLEFDVPVTSRIIFKVSKTQRGQILLYFQKFLHMTLCPVSVSRRQR